MKKLPKGFYLRSALSCAKEFLGKVLVHHTSAGRVSGIVYDVEAYPAFSDEVHHGNKKTPRTEIMWDKGGYAYVYTIYGVWNQFAVVVNKKNIPDVVFIRAAFPVEGIEMMRRQWKKKMEHEELSNSPGKLCRSFLITKNQYGMDLTANELFFEDWGIRIKENWIQTSKRIGIRPIYKGYDAPLRYFINIMGLMSIL